MNAELLEELKKITPEEERLLSGAGEIERRIYMSPRGNLPSGAGTDREQEIVPGTDVVDAAKLMEAGKMIQVRPHTRFVHFPRHTHNYIEVIYMCSGSTHHVINGEDVILQQGELLFLSQWAVQEIYPAGEEDIAVNFIVLPQFFEYGLGSRIPAFSGGGCAAGAESGGKPDLDHLEQAAQQAPGQPGHHGASFSAADELYG